MSTVRIWHLGDDVDTDQLAPGQYMKFDVATIADHCLERSAPDFAREVRAGDIIVAGRNFGCGSSREQAPAALKHLGVRAVVARSFAGLFYRNAFNLGLLLLQSADGERLLGAHDVVFDPGSGQISFDTSPATMRQTIRCEPVPDFLLEYVAVGGLLPYLKARRSAANQLAVNTGKM